MSGGRADAAARGRLLAFVQPSPRSRGRRHPFCDLSGSRSSSRRCLTVPGSARRFGSRSQCRRASRSRAEGSPRVRTAAAAVATTRAPPASSTRARTSFFQGTRGARSTRKCPSTAVTASIRSAGVTVTATGTAFRTTPQRARDLRLKAALRTRKAVALSSTQGVKLALRQRRVSTLRIGRTLLLIVPTRLQTRLQTYRRPRRRRRAVHHRPLDRRLPLRTGARRTTTSDFWTLQRRTSRRRTWALPIRARSTRAATANPCTGVCPWCALGTKEIRAPRDRIAARVSPALRKRRRGTRRLNNRGGAIPIAVGTRSAKRSPVRTEVSTRRSARPVRSSRAKVRRRSPSRCVWPSITAVSTSRIRARAGRRARAPVTWPAPSSVTPTRPRRVFARARGDLATPAPRASPARGAICAHRRVPV